MHTNVAYPAESADTGVVAYVMMKVEQEAAAAIPPLSRTNFTFWTIPKGLKAAVSMST